MLLKSGRLMLGLWLAEACAERKRALCSLLEVGWRGLGHQVLGLGLLGCCCCPVVVGLEAGHITALNNASWRHSIVRIGSAKGARKACAGCEVRRTLLRLTWIPGYQQHVPRAARIGSTHLVCSLCWVTAETTKSGTKKR